MQQPLPLSKTSLRASIRSRLQKLPETERAQRSERACALLQQQPIWAQANSILFYAPLAGELDLWPLLLKTLAWGKTVALPGFIAEKNQYAAFQIKDVERDLHLGNFGIREPNPHSPCPLINRLDLILVPGLAFDLHGHRLGRGKGFYDRLLMTVRGLTCGCAFDEQIVLDVPGEPHDVLVNRILTPTRWIEL